MPWPARPRTEVCVRIALQKFLCHSFATPERHAITATSHDLSTAADRERELLLRRYGIDPSGENVATLAAYAGRARRSRWWGVVGVFVAVGAGLFGSTGHTLGQRLAWIFVGYLVGSEVAEVLSPRRRATGAIHTASLAIRQPSLLLPAWARTLPWLVLLPCTASPLLLWGDHPRGVTRVHDRSGSSMVQASWFSAPALVCIAIIATAALALWWLTLRQLARRRLPVERLGAARLDVLTRALSARAVSGAAAALGLSLLSGLAFLGIEPLMSMTCTSPADCHYLYAAHARYDVVQNVGLLLLMAAVLVFWFSRLPRVDRSLLTSTTGSS